MSAFALFEPDPHRARSLDLRMRNRLAVSLGYIAGQVEALLPLEARALGEFTERLRRTRVPALVFGAYFDLVMALEAQDLAAAKTLIAELVNSAALPDDLRVTDLGDVQTDADADRYRRLIDSDPEAPFAMFSPSADDSAACRARIAAALSLLERGDPDALSEFDELIGEIVLAVGLDDPAAPTFDGASSFMLWGAIVLNARAHSTVLETTLALVHESSHNLLFGLCADGPLVTNEGSDRYSSPLRTDLRPMDGIVHATYVTARMHRSTSALLGSGVLDAALRAEAEQALKDQRRAFDAGMDVVECHAILTPLGEGVMAGVRAHMAKAA